MPAEAFEAELVLAESLGSLRVVKVVLGIVDEVATVSRLLRVGHLRLVHGEVLSCGCSQVVVASCVLGLIYHRAEWLFLGLIIAVNFNHFPLELTAKRRCTFRIQSSLFHI